MRSNSPVSGAHVVDQPVSRYRAALLETAGVLEAARTSSSDGWSPAFRLPPADAPEWDAYFASTPLRMIGIGSYAGRAVDMIDLTGNPATRTTKSLASHLIVARAVLHAQRTGRRVTIVTPTSGNKGTALRDAVARAQNAGIAGADRVRVVMLVMPASRAKLRLGINDGDPAFRSRNPVVVMDVATGAELKALGAAAAAAMSEQAGDGDDIWFSLHLDNYRFADAMRAFLEHDALAGDGDRDGGPRLHVHAVSSAYGFLGYELGRRMLDRLGAVPPLPQAQYLLVQHLGAPDMVEHLRASQGRPGRPAYHRDGPAGPFVQAEDPCFPFVTDDPAEVLDPTFYTRRPPTAPAMTGLIAVNGGAGIVVSARECVHRFEEIRALLGDTIALPADWRQLREWSVVMACCGMMNALDRGVVDADRIVLHGSGVYWDEVLAPLPDACTVQLHDLDALLAFVASS